MGVANKKKRMVPELRFGGFEDEWTCSKIENHFEFKNGLNKEKEYFGQGTPIINFKDVFNLSDIKREDILGLVTLSDKELKNYSALRGDVFFTRTSEIIDEIGMSATLVEDIPNCVFSGFVLRARPKNQLFDDLFKSYCFSIETVRKEIVTKSSFTTRALTSGTLLNKVEFSFPSKAEQKKIADFLSAVDARIQHLGRKKELLEQYKKGVMQQLFSQELRFKRPDGTNYPDWEEKRLGEIGLIQTGKTPSTADEELWNGDIQFITPTDIEEGRKYQQITSRSVADNTKLKVLPIGSIVYTCIASIGKIAITTKRAITNQQINAVVVKNNWNSELVYYQLLWLTPRIKSTQANTTLPIINKTEFSKLKLLLPSSKEEQQKIADFLSALDKKIEAVSTQIAKTQQFKKGLLQKMFV